MKKLTVGLSFSLFLVVALLTFTLFFTMEDVKAAPTTITYVTEMYSCNLVNGSSCTEGTYHYTEVEESVWHILFDSHPHATESIYVTRNTVDTVEACENCLGPG